MLAKQYTVYILRCGDGSLYCGYTTNLKHRLHAHNHLRSGAKYTKNKRPVSLVYSQLHQTKSEALKSEAAIKKLTRIQKLALIGK